jgi:hypothetical protein
MSDIDTLRSRLDKRVLQLCMFVLFGFGFGFGFGFVFFLFFCFALVACISGGALYIMFENHVHS